MAYTNVAARPAPQNAIRPYRCGLWLFLNAVVIDHHDVDPEALRQMHGSPRVDSIVDRDEQVCSTP